MSFITPAEMAVLDAYHAQVGRQDARVFQAPEARKSNAGRKPVVTKEQTNKTRSLACRGFSTRQIATQVGLSQSTVMRLLRRAG